MIGKLKSAFVLAFILMGVFFFSAPGFSSEEQESGEPLYRQLIVRKAVQEPSVEAEDEALKPMLNNGGKFRIGIIESGVWTGFIYYFDAVVDALTNLGWGDPKVYASLTEAERETIPAMIKALNEKGWSPYIEFPAEAYERLAMETKKEGTARIASIHNLDMIVGLGTWAGQELRALPDSFVTPCVIMAVSSPIESKILDSPTDSGRDNITGSVELDRFKRQIQLFHDIIGFKRLGVVYAGSDPTAAQYAAISDIMDIQKQRGFELITATDVPPSGAMDEINRKFIENVKSIVDNIDAFYLTLQNGVNDKTIPTLVKIFSDHGIPTFYMGGSSFVKRGVLFSIATNWKIVGAFNAPKIVRILKKEARPRDLNMILDAEPRIAINLATATAIGYDPSVDVLAGSDEIYSIIEE
jgi:ABC-type uncharacterized transport system substrate-binding protein